jgi:hypothetical protein
MQFDYHNETEARLAWNRILDFGERSTEQVEVPIKGSKNGETESKTKVTVKFQDKIITYLV